MYMYVGVCYAMVWYIGNLCEGQCAVTMDFSGFHIFSSRNFAQFDGEIFFPKNLARFDNEFLAYIYLMINTNNN